MGSTGEGMEDPISMRRLMLILLTLGLVSGQSSNVKYLVVAPAVLPYPSTQTVCVYIVSPKVSATLSVSLMVKTTSSGFKTLVNKGAGQLHCKTIKVPPPMNGKEEITTLTINITSDVFKQSEKKSVVIRPMRNRMFVQTDRPVYQPGDKLIVKAVDFDEHFMARNDKFSLVILKDDQGNIVKQWQNVQPKGGIMDVSCDLSPDLREGEYRIMANKNGSVAEVPITVDKSALPKFEISIDCPESVSMHQKKFLTIICGKYTYGKSVKGNIIGKFCRLSIDGSGDVCKQINGKTDVNGCYTVEVDPDYFKFKRDGYNSYLDVVASLEEDGSGVERKATKHIFITEVLATAGFKESRSYYKQGLAYRGGLILTGPDGLPMPDQDIELSVDGERREQIYTTDNNGVAKFVIESTQLSDRVINLRAKYRPREPVTVSGERKPVYNDGYASLMPSYTSTVSQLKIRSEPSILPCNEKVNLWADYVLDPSEHTTKTINFHCLVITRGEIVSSSTKTHTIAPSGGLRSFFPVSVTVTANMSPAATILMYTSLDNGEMIADSVKIPVTSCFPNTVSLQFSEEQSLPGSMLNLHITAYPNSMCNIRAVDKSVHLLKLETQRAEDTVNEFLKEWDAETDGYPINVEELLSLCPPGSIPVFEEATKSDIFSIYEKCGMKVVTNFVIRKPLQCKLLPRPPHILDRFPVFESTMSVNNLESSNTNEAFSLNEIIVHKVPLPLPPPQAKVRKNFLSTWIMNTVSIGDTGELDYPVKSPDTITEWIADAFCTSAIGLGFSPRTQFQSFQPYFVEPIMPYSIKQGETFMLKAIVLNFMKRCMKVSATLYHSKDFQLQPCEGCSYSACLCSNPTTTFTWNIKPLTLGTINITIGTEALNTNDLCDGQKPIVPTKGKSDIVQKRLIVEAQGLPVENTRSWLFCAFESETIPLTLPQNVVLGSQTAVVTVTGDIMGKPLSNLNHLLRLPTGCGEQNMILLGPIAEMIKYAGITGQLTDALVNKARSLMETGYQNQLNYRHNDGAFSAFGQRDPSGSTWLTGFAARIFHLCRSQIDIEERHITGALDWLKKQQESNGCFKNVGRVIHKELMGGVDSQISLTAYITSAFLEVNDPKYVDVIEKAKKCLVGCTQPESSIHAKAQCAYTYTLLGDTVKRTELLKQLDKLAIKKVGKTYWSTKSQVPSVDPLWPTPNPADVETTAYVIKALVSGDDASKADLAAAVPGIRWLYSQQNGYGGFCNTQDTVVGLSAFSEYGSKTYVDENMPTTTITNDKGFKAEVTVDPKKPSEVHVVPLPHIPAVYTLEASGSGCAYVQITERYNILDPEPERTILLQVKTSSIHCAPHPVPSFKIDINVRLSDASKDEGTNMAIVEIKFISGFVPKEDTVNRLLSNDMVKKVENKQTGIIIYLDKITITPIVLSVDMEQQCEVQNLHSAVVFVKDYYENSKHVEKTYKNPCK